MMYEVSFLENRNKGIEVEVKQLCQKVKLDTVHITTATTVYLVHLSGSYPIKWHRNDGQRMLSDQEMPGTRLNPSLPIQNPSTPQSLLDHNHCFQQDTKRLYRF